MIETIKRTATLGLLLTVFSCANVSVTKTGKGYFAPTSPGKVEVLTTVPTNKPFTEIGVLTVTKFQPDEIAKMHNALREKGATIGAEAVIITQQGMSGTGPYGAMERWASATAVVWNKKQAKK